MSPIEIILPGETLPCDPQGAGFAHGFGLFETLRVEAGHLYFWEAHWARLSSSAAALGIDLPVGPCEVLAAIRELVRELRGNDVYLVKVSLYGEAHAARLVVYSRPASPVPERVGLLGGAGASVCEASLLAGHKTHNYMENRLLIDLARSQGCYDVVRLSTGQVVAEGALSNFFWSRDGVLFTPAVSTGLLPGTVRAALLRSTEVAEGRYPLEHLWAADAVFLTNSSCGVLPVDWLRAGETDRALTSRFSPEYARLLAAYEVSARDGRQSL